MKKRDGGGTAFRFVRESDRPAHLVEPTHWRHARLDITWLDRTRPERDGQYGLRPEVVHGGGRREVMRQVLRTVDAWRATHPVAEQAEVWLLLMTDEGYHTGDIGKLSNLAFCVRFAEDARRGRAGAEGFSVSDA
jgi:hypothetical protein